MSATAANFERIPVLWQLEISHYNEKVRWALDYTASATTAARCLRGRTS